MKIPTEGAALKPATAKTERPPSAQLRKAVFGGSLVIRRSSTAPSGRLCFVALTLVLTLATSGISSGQQPGTKLWQFPVKGEGTYSPALASDGTIYVGSNKVAPAYEAILFAVTPTGAEKWRVDLGLAPDGIAAAVGGDGTIYAGGYGGIKVVRPDGVIMWVAGGSGPCSCVPTIGADGAIYVTYLWGACPFVSVGPDGVVRWMGGWNKFFSVFPSLGVDGRLYGSGFCLNPDGSTNQLLASLGSFPTLGLNGNIYSVVGTNLFNLTSSGATNWVFHSSREITSSPSLADDQTIYLGIDSNLVALTGAGVQKWVFETRGVVRSSPAISADGTIYFGSEDKNLYAVAAEGTKRWEFATAGAIRSPPAIGTDGTVYIVSADGNLYAIKGTVGLANSPWPKFRGNARNTGNVADSPWSLTQPPSILSQPLSVFRRTGENATFSVTAAGQPPLHYQWHNGTGILANATNSSLSLTNVQFATAGGYSVVVTNSFGSVTSTVAQLTVYTNLVLTQTNRAPTINEIGKPTIPTDPTHFKVFTNRTLQSGIALDPNKMTVVITHGWNGSSTDWPTVTAQNIAQRIGASTVNIVAWDWAEEAQSEPTGLGRIAAKTPGQGTALGTNLVAALGANYSQRIHFVGHSLGTLVNGHAANYVHAHGFSWTNTQMTLCDEAEAAWEFTSTGWQLATTLPKIIISGNFSTPQRYWDRPLPEHFAWADNYISAVGLLHPDAANAILTWDYPTHGSSDFASWLSDWALFHAFSHDFYEDTIEPGWYNTGGKTNATYMGFICSFEGGGTASRPATNTIFYQNPVGSGYELDLVPTTLSFATDFLNDRLWSVLVTATETRDNIGWNFFGDAVGLVFGQINSVGNNVRNMFVNLSTTGGSSPQIQSGSVRPLGGPVPNGGPSPINTPAYAWIPITVPSNVVSMSFDFMLQGNGNQDSFQVALQGTNILSLETSLIQTNVTLNSGLIDISQYAGQQVELFLGIVGGTSTNAALTVSDFQFYVTLPPSLQIQLSGTNVVLTWPLSGAGYVLQSANNLTPLISWTTVTNVPVIVNFQYTVTNQISDTTRFYRLRK